MYRYLECDNEKRYRWHNIDDIKKPDNPILQLIVKQVKESISNSLTQIEGVTIEMVTEMMEKYVYPFIGIQTIQCPSCKCLQVDVIINSRTKIRDDLWISYETNRFVRKYMGGRQW